MIGRICFIAEDANSVLLCSQKLAARVLTLLDAQGHSFSARCSDRGSSFCHEGSCKLLSSRLSRNSKGKRKSCSISRVSAKSHYAVGSRQYESFRLSRQELDSIKSIFSVRRSHADSDKHVTLILQVNNQLSTPGSSEGKLSNVEDAMQKH